MFDGNNGICKYQYASGESTIWIANALMYLNAIEILSDNAINKMQNLVLSTSVFLLNHR